MLARRYDAPTLEKWGPDQSHGSGRIAGKGTMAIAEEFGARSDSRPRRDQGARARSPSTTVSPRRRGRWQGCRRRSWASEDLKTGWPPSARTAPVLPNSRGADHERPSQRNSYRRFLPRAGQVPLCARTLQDLGRPRSSRSNRQARTCRALRFHRRRHVGLLRAAERRKTQRQHQLNIPGAYDLAPKTLRYRPISWSRIFAPARSLLRPRLPNPVEAQSAADLRIDHRYGQGGPWRSRMAYAPTVRRGRFTGKQRSALWRALKEPRTDSLSHADVYAGLQA